MGKVIKKRIGTFADYCKTKTQQIKENNQVAIDVPFWYDAINAGLEDLHSLGGYPVDWAIMVEKIKRKFSLLSIFDRDLFTDDSFVIAEVKDVIYHKFGADAFLSGDVLNSDYYNTEEMGAKALVISKLADAVLKRVKEEAGLDGEPEPEEPIVVSTVSLEADYGDEDYLQYEQRSVVGFDDFTSRLKENVDRIRRQDDGRGLDYCLNTIESVAGSIKMDDILKVIKKENTDLKSYLFRIAEGYMKTASIKLNESKSQNPKEQMHVFEQAQKSYSREIVRKVMGMINKETQKDDEKVKRNDD